MSNTTIKILGGLAAGIAASVAANMISKQVRGKYLVDPQTMKDGLNAIGNEAQGLGNEVKNLGTEVLSKTRKLANSKA